MYLLCLTLTTMPFRIPPHCNEVQHRWQNPELYFVCPCGDHQQERWRGEYLLPYISHILIGNTDACLVVGKFLHAPLAYCMLGFPQFRSVFINDNVSATEEFVYPCISVLAIKHLQHSPNSSVILTVPFTLHIYLFIESLKTWHVSKAWKEESRLHKYEVHWHQMCWWDIQSSHPAITRRYWSQRQCPGGACIV